MNLVAILYSWVNAGTPTAQQPPKCRCSWSSPSGRRATDAATTELSLFDVRCEEEVRCGHTHTAVATTTTHRTRTAAAAAITTIDSLAGRIYSGGCAVQ